ncbi:spore germination protein [Paenibacillus rhizovicinus]|uniref:Spore germination protein n=1 Tax=Paenibacillus rhizovicinus TaxID=2704463 RepID=A0A6C0NU93_9BACL|nr:spore germination protein [Paenibacillus rhizovicinus]QHW29737.1 spore germination protein [Paenibacillus rhizovicinus]
MKAFPANRRPQTFIDSEPLPPLSASAENNVSVIRQLLGSPSDLSVRSFTIGSGKLPCVLLCIDGLIDKQLINEQVLKPLIQRFADEITPEPAELPNLIIQEILSVTEVELANAMDEVDNGILSGNAALFVDGSAQVVLIDCKGWQTRAIEEPQTESIIRGSREGFNENLRTNTAIVRRMLRDNRLRFDSLKIGRRSKREVVLLSMDGIVNPQLHQEAVRRLKSIDTDDISGSGTVEQFISDNFLSPFPLVITSERPDKVTGGLLQGRLAVLVDGDPFAIIFPITFSSNIQSPEDFYQQWFIAMATRILRMMAAFIATFLPAIYIALLEYHHGMIPSSLAFSIAGSREGVPFPAVIEAFMMEGTLELLREAGIRLPKPIGQTIGIVGGLVIGEAAVSAGIVSPVMVIVVAVTAISSFSFPSYSFAIALRLVRFAIMLAASLFGLYGIILAYIIINIHFVNLKSFGVPYSAPFAPFYSKDWSDVIVRAPATMLKERPTIIDPVDKTRQADNNNGDDNELF